MVDTMIKSTILFLLISQVDPFDRTIIEEIKQYNLEQMLREQYSKQKGCPIPVSYYWNMDCA